MAKALKAWRMMKRIFLQLPRAQSGAENDLDILFSQSSRRLPTRSYRIGKIDNFSGLINGPCAVRLPMFEPCFLIGNVVDTSRTNDEQYLIP